MMKLISVKQAAEELNLRPVTVRQWIARRRLTVVRLGRSVKVPVEEIDRLIQAGTVPAKVERHG